jgi:xanthine dehydrogenase large subunit
VFLAIRDAVAATAPDAPHAPVLRAPATPEAILDAIDALKPAATNVLAASPTAPETAPAGVDTTA